MNANKIIAGLVTKKHPTFAPGDTISIHIKIKEGEKERVQIFEGIVIRRSGGGNTASFTVRKISFGVGVERIFPVECSNIEKIEVLKRGKVRRAKLFYIRELQGKSLRITDHDNQYSDAGTESETETSSSKATAKKKVDTQEAASA